MNLKILLPMGKKPPDILGRGEDATPIQAPIVLSFHNACQILEELSVLLSTILRSTTCSLIVIIFYGTGPPSLLAVDRIFLGCRGNVFLLTRIAVVQTLPLLPLTICASLRPSS